MKRLIGNVVGLIIFLFLLQVAIGMIPAVAAITQSVFKQLVPNLDLSYSSGEIPIPDPSWPTLEPEPEPTGHPIPTETSVPIESPEPTATPLPEVTVDPVVPEPSPEATITWICPIVGEGGC